MFRSASTASRGVRRQRSWLYWWKRGGSIDLADAVTQIPGGIVVGMVLLAWQVPQASVRADEVPPAAADAADLRPVVDRYCVVCHNGYVSTPATASGVVLDRADLNDVGERSGAVGEGRAQAPDRRDAACRNAASRSGDLRNARRLARVAPRRAATQRPNPGRPAIHRLNRAEYANAIRDLLALEVDASTLLPPDDSADGFDNNADILACRRRCSSAICRQRPRSARSPWAARRSRPAPRPTASAATRRRPSTSTGCRSARAAASPRGTRSRSTASTSSR